MSAGGNLIQIKRSLSTATPGSLANGELAFAANGDVLYIGSNSTVVAIGGKREPGTLTANQALVANATSYLDAIKVANATIDKVYANGAFGTSGQVLLANSTGGLYWGAAASALDDLTDVAVSGASAGQVLVSNSTGFFRNVSLSGDITVSDTGIVSIAADSVALGTDTTGDYIQSITASNGLSGTISSEGAAATLYVIANSGIIANSSGVFANTDNSTLELSGGAIRVKDDGIALGTKTTGNYVATITAGNGLSGNATTEGSAPTIAVVAGSGIASNSTGVFVVAGNGITSNSTGVFVTDGDGLSVNSTGVHVGAGNGLSVNSSAVAVVANNGLASNSSGVFVVAGNGIASNSTGVHVVAGTGVVSNATGVFIGQAVGTTDNVTFNDVTINGNTAIGSNYSDVVSIYAGVNTNILPSTNATYSLGNNTVRWNEVHSANVHTTSLTVDTDATINGNLVVSGSLVTINVATLSVTDSLIELASNNTVSDILDIGFFGNYNTGAANVHAGMFRDATTDTFKLFKGLEPAPTTTVNISGTGYTQATLETYLSSGALVSNSTAVTLTANSTVAVNMTANSLTLTTALAGTSGGTGLASYTAEDILVANSSNGFRKLSAGSDGYVLQISSGVLTYGTLDGGTF